MPRDEVQRCLRFLAVATFGGTYTILPLGTAACEPFCNPIILRRRVDVSEAPAALRRTPRIGPDATAFLHPSTTTDYDALCRPPLERVPARRRLATPGKRPRSRASGPGARAAAAGADGQEFWFHTESLGFWGVDARNYDGGRGVRGGSDGVGRGLISAEVDSLRRPQQQQQGVRRSPSPPTPSSLSWCQTRRTLEAHSEEVKAIDDACRPQQTPDPDAAVSPPEGVVGSAMGNAEEEGRVSPPAGTGERRTEREFATAADASAVAIAGGGADAEEDVVELKWDHRAARDKAGEALPQLAEAFRSFDEKHPGATIIYLAHSGSRLYGTSTPTSDVDVKGIFIPDSRKEKEARRAASQAAAAAAEGEHEGGGEVTKAVVEVEDNTNKEAVASSGAAAEASSASTPAQDQAPAACGSSKDGKEVSFWYSTGDCASANTMEDVDMELISIGRFFGQLFRGEVGGVETLHSMQADHVELIRDPEIVPVILRERRWLVSSQLSSWIGFVLSHVSKYRKVTNKEAVERHLAFKRKLKRQQRREQQQQQPGLPAADLAAEVEAIAGSRAASPAAAARTGAAASAAAPSTIPTAAETAAGAGDWTDASVDDAADSAATERVRQPGVGGTVVAGGEGRTGAPQTGAGASSEEGPRLGLISRRAEDGSSGKPKEAPSPERPRKLGVLSRGGVEVVAASEGGEQQEEEDGDDEEEDGVLEAKQRARRIRRGKLALHARRGVIEAEELLTTGRLTFPLKPRHVTELLRLKELGFHPKKVAAVQAQARNLANIAATSGLPREVSREKMSDVQAEVMEIHYRRRHPQPSAEGVAGD